MRKFLKIQGLEGDFVMEGEAQICLGIGYPIRSRGDIAVVTTIIRCLVEKGSSRLKRVGTWGEGAFAGRGAGAVTTTFNEFFKRKLERTVQANGGIYYRQKRGKGKKRQAGGGQVCGWEK